MKLMPLYCIIIFSVFAAAMVKNSKPSVSSTRMELGDLELDQVVLAPVRIQECATPSTSSENSCYTLHPYDYAGLERMISGASRLLDNMNSMPLTEFENEYNEILRSYQEARVFYDWGRLGEPENMRLFSLLMKLTSIFRSLDNASRRSMWQRVHLRKYTLLTRNKLELVL